MTTNRQEFTALTLESAPAKPAGSPTKSKFTMTDESQLGQFIPLHYHVLMLQSDVARDIAGNIETKLARQQVSRAVPNKRLDPETYEDYLRGRYFLARRTAEAMNTAADYFQRPDDGEFRAAVYHWHARRHCYHSGHDGKTHGGYPSDRNKPARDRVILSARSRSSK